MIALVASVVPWITMPTSAGENPAARKIAGTPSITPCSGADCVVRTFAVVRTPPCSSARSVKVPPISTASRANAIASLRPLLHEIAARIGLVQRAAIAAVPRRDVIGLVGVAQAHAEPRPRQQ